LGRGKIGSEIKTAEENCFTLTEISLLSGNKFRINSKTYHKLNDGWGSFRWGGTCHIDENGYLRMIAAPKHYKWVDTSDFGVRKSDVFGPY